MAKSGLVEKGASEAPAQDLQPLAGGGELAGNGPAVVSAGGVDLVWVRTKAGPRVFQGRCPHQGALLGEGELEGDTLVCRNHRWRYSADTGRREGGPQCLVACPIVERGGELLVDVAPLAAAATQAQAARPALRRLRDLPGPRGLPLLGNSLELDPQALHTVLEKWAQEYGSLYVFRLGPQRTLAVSDPALCQQVLRSRPELFRRVSRIQSVFRELAVDGVFSAEGPAWRPQRRLSMEALSHRHLRGFYPTLRAVATRLHRRWQAAAERGQPIDMIDELKRFTVDVTTMLTFGHDMNTIEQAGDDIIQRRLEHLFPAFSRRILALVPTWRFVRSSKDRQLDRAMAELRAWIDGLVRDARARVAAEPARAEAPANFLEAMLAARDEAGQPFSEDVVFANLMTMLVAGEDTTAYTLAWAIHHMCDAPEAVRALRAELDAAMGGDAVPGDIETATRFAYAGAVGNEAMRLRPVAPVLFLEALADTTLGDVEVPAGTVVVVLARPPVRDPARFHDPEIFRPERWLPAAPDAPAPGPHDAATHIPFGSGPRICPGRTLALLEMKVLIALLYKSFDVVRHGDAADVRELFLFTMSPSSLQVTLRRRAPSDC
jgi:cytochrome P450/nitrite reductase/ring-hydroxylating ferredoxin subunit